MCLLCVYHKKHHKDQFRNVKMKNLQSYLNQDLRVNAAKTMAWMEPKGQILNRLHGYLKAAICSFKSRASTAAPSWGVA